MIRSLVLVLAGLLAVALPATAQQASAPGQQPVGRPFRGIFGGSNETDAGLDLTVSFQQAYDDDVTGQSGSGSASSAGRMVGGYYSTASVGLSYDHRGDVLSLSASGMTAGNYYPDLEDLSGLSHYGDAALTAAFGDLTLGVAGSVGQSPYYSFALVPVPIDPGQLVAGPRLFDVDLIRTNSLFYQGRVTATKQFTTRTSLSASGGYRKTDFTAGPGDTAQVSGSLQFSRNFTRSLSLRAGYSFSEGQYQDAAGRSSRSHDLTIGSGYERQHSRTRRTALNFSTGATALEDQQGRRYRFAGSAGLHHQMGRSWTANVQFNRGADYVDGLMEPLLTDRVSAAVHGFLSRRVDTSFTAGYSEGVIGLAANAPGFTNYFGTAMVRVAVTRLMAVTGQYLYYQYEFERQPIPELPRFAERHGARVGLSLWLPLVR